MRREHLRAAIRDGLDSGPVTPLDMDDIRAEGHRRLAALRGGSDEPA